MKKDNRGLSLVELIIVIAILAVLAGAAGYGIGLVTGRPADKCANKLKSLIQNNRITTMGKLSAKLEIFVDAEGFICVTETVETDGASPKVTTSRIGDRGVTLSYRLTGESAFQTLGTTPLIISFNRSSGAFNALDVAGMGAVYAGKYCEEIEISKGSRTKILKLSYLTGKITLE